MNIARLCLYIGLLLLVGLAFIFHFLYLYLLIYFVVFIIEEMLIEFISLKIFKKIRNDWRKILLLHEELKKFYKALLICSPIFLLTFIFLKTLLWFLILVITMSILSLVYETIKEIENNILKT